jgi:hypothetical protein
MTETGLAIKVSQPEEISALSRWDALALDIAGATEESNYKEFDYHDKRGNAQARSWISTLRRLKGRIERARVEAKAVHLERGRAIDQTARLLEASVQSLIDPHEREIKAIQAKEQARIDLHRAVLDRIASMPVGVSTSEEARARLVELEAISVDGLEEFSTAGEARKAEAQERLESALTLLLVQEAERSELEALRAEKAAREEQIKRQQALISEPHRGSVQVPLPRHDAPVSVRDEAAFQSIQQDAQGQSSSASHRQPEPEGGHFRKNLYQVILAAVSGKSREEIVAMLVGETLHPAICIDWDTVKSDESLIPW